MTNYVYLGGPITGQTFGRANDWRLHFADTLSKMKRLGTMDWKCFNPLHGKEQYDTGGPLPDAFDGDVEVADEDFDYILRSDVVVANFAVAEQVSIGTCVELGFAHAHGKPIIVVTGADELHDHLFIRRVATYRVDNVHGALKILHELQQEWQGVPTLRAA